MRQYPLDEKTARRFDNDFTYHAPFEDQAERYGKIREMAKQYALFVASVCPPSRELSLALTNVENAVFYANAAIARNETPSK